MYIHICICILHIHMHIYVYIHIHMYVYTYIYAHVCIYIAPPPRELLCHDLVRLSWISQSIFIDLSMYLLCLGLKTLPRNENLSFL